MTTATRTKPISYPQISFVKSLLAQREVTQDVRDMLAGFTAEDVSDLPNVWTTRDASSIIDLLKALPYAPKAPAADALPVEEEADEPGLYEVNGVLFHVKFNQSKTRIYAMQLTDDGYVYAGAIYKNKIAKSHRISIERAVELSGARGQCIRCLRTLKDPKSIKRSMGKWCADRI